MAATTDPRSFLGALVVVQVDRPLGSRHPRHGFVYPVNYGFVPGTRAADGEELDAYVLGIDRPCERFEGRCVAYLVRPAEQDDKLIVVPDGSSLSDAQIRALTEFQEWPFRPEIRRS